MELVNNNANNNLFTDLTDEETTALNGGGYCITRRIVVAVRRGWRIFYAYRIVRYCY